MPIQIKSEQKILDVGCGSLPQGDVNLDLKPANQEIPNFIEGNALSLPFEENSFTTVFSSNLSLFTDNFSDEDLIKAWKEALRVAKSQIIFEYHYTPNIESWPVRHPFTSLRIFKEHVSPNVTLSYSQRGKRSGIIRIFEKIFGTKLTIFIVTRIFRTSYFAKLHHVIEKSDSTLIETRTYTNTKINND